METMDSIMPEQTAEIAQEQQAQPSVSDEINRIEGEINEYRALLANTDWCIIKCLETGEDMEALYPDQSAARAEARNRINDLEKELPALYESFHGEKSEGVESTPVTAY